MGAFIALGHWQWQRGVARQQSWDAFARTDVAAREADSRAIATLPPYTRIRVTGQWDASRQFLLDNISHGGAPGYNALTLLRLPEGGTLLVNRGWIAFSGFRDRLPDITLGGEGPVTVTGRLAQLPVGGLSSGRQPPPLEGPWPRVTSFPTLQELGQSAQVELLPRLLLLDSDSADGYLREWQPPGVPPERHFSYAVQWWMFAAAAFGLYLALNLKVSR